MLTRFLADVRQLPDRPHIGINLPKIGIILCVSVYQIADYSIGTYARNCNGLFDNTRYVLVWCDWEYVGSMWGHPQDVPLGQRVPSAKTRLVFATTTPTHVASTAHCTVLVLHASHVPAGVHLVNSLGTTPGHW